TLRDGRGCPRRFRVEAVPLRGWPGGLAALVVLQDLTEAARLAKLRRDVLLAISHELRTPLTSLRGYAQLLRRGSLDEEGRRRALEVMCQNVDELAELVEKVVLASRLMAAPSRVHCPVELIPAVAAALAAARDRLADVGVTVDVQLPAELGRVHAHPDHLREMVTQLLANAARYAGPGATLRIVGRREGDMAVLVFEDDGRGIAPEEQELVFEPFYRSPAAEQDGLAGVGLGLYIVRRIAEVCGGRVELESEAGRGARFTVHLPLAQEEPSAEPAG
ncbi:MAG: HAMP domain-containing histidine kinase, partial [Clostridia bacterium]|nr:HAMP domain-containing histidine kinase [Clostridia bacterium]